VRETRTYEAILRAIATGRHTPAEIAAVTGLTSSNLSPYLARLRELGLIERRIRPPSPRSAADHHPQPLPPARLLPALLLPLRRANLELVELELTDILWERISEQFRAFVGLTAFEELCRDWLLVQARARELPFSPEIVGSHWAPNAQVDVVALTGGRGPCSWASASGGSSRPAAASSATWWPRPERGARRGVADPLRLFARPALPPLPALKRRRSTRC